MKKRITRVLAALVVGLFLLPLMPTTSVLAVETQPTYGLCVQVGGVTIYQQNDSADATWNRSWPGASYDPGSNTLTLKSVNGDVYVWTDAEDAAKNEVPASINIRNLGDTEADIYATGDINISGSGTLYGSLYAGNNLSITNPYYKSSAISISGVKVESPYVEAARAVTVNVGSGGSLVITGTINAHGGNRGGLRMAEGGVLTVQGSAVMMEGTGPWSQPTNAYAVRKGPDAEVVKAISLRRALSGRDIPTAYDSNGDPIAWKTERYIADCTKYPYVSIQPAAKKLEMTKSLTLFPGQSKVLYASSFPEGTAQTKVTYTSNKKSVATVDKNTGRVIAIKAGKAKITAKNAQGKKATCTVTVNPKPASGKTPVSDVELNRNELHLSPRRSYTLKATTYPSQKKDANVKLTWKSSDPEVATVNAKGKVVAKAEGECYIYATANDGGVRDACFVIVQ